MKCLHCKAESSDDKVCTNCSREITEAGVKVQYRDFRGSEMLDIQMPPKPASSVQDEETLSGSSDSRADRLRESRFKKIFLIAAVVAGSIMAWYFVLKYLLGF